MKTIWCMIPETWSTTDWIFFHLGPFLPLLPSPSPNNSGNQNFKNEKNTWNTIILLKCTKNDNHMKYEVQQTEFVLFGNFLPFYPANNQKNQNFEKMKKSPCDIILHKCTKNHYHMLYCTWDRVQGGCNCYFSFWTIFCLYTP